MAALVLLESMFRRKMRARRRRANPTRPCSTSNSTQTVELMKCRICLKEGTIPIFQQTTIYGYESFADDIRKFGDIELTEGDELPKALCPDCYGLLQAAIRFRKLAQRSDRKLRKTGIREEIKNPSTEKCTDFDTSEGIAESLDCDYDKEEEENVFYCRKCQLDFTNAEDLLEHRKSESHVKPRVQCQECGVTVCKGSLKAHVARLHTKAQPHICDVCGKSFVMKGSFKRHLLIHTDELPFACDSCPYRCRYRASLKEHTRVHTGEKPYACHRCPARFPNASNLRKHTRTHQAHHDLKCEHCDKGFHTMHKMRAHIKVDHMGLKEHVCDVCGKEFGYKEKLGQHLKNVHKRPKKRSGRLPLYLEIDQKNHQHNAPLQNTNIL